jgi:hypothetical protein
MTEMSGCVSFAIELYLYYQNVSVHWNEVDNLWGQKFEDSNSNFQTECYGAM